jgi:hypothetical protein
MDRNALIRAAFIGLVLQLAMVILGHFVTAIRDPGFAIGGTGFSFIAGLIFARTTRMRWGPSSGGGAIAGGLCGLLGILVSVLLGDVPPSLLIFGTFGSTIAGAVGGLLGRLLYRLQAAKAR